LRDLGIEGFDKASNFSKIRMSNIEQGMSNNRSFLKEINQYPLLRYSAVPCSAVQNKRSGSRGVAY
jgi:hypothetical protein